MKRTAGCYEQGKDRQKLRLDLSDLVLIALRHPTTTPPLRPQPALLSLRDVTQEVFPETAQTPREGRGQGTTLPGTGRH